MRTLLTGAKGQLARCLRDRLPEDWELIATDSTSLDITDTEAVHHMIKNFQPDAIVNAAAYTAVDKAEENAEAAFAVNASAVHNLAAAARAAHARFIHISTDYVFDGEGKRPYRETDYTNPRSTYGQSKVAGELLALAAHPESIIIRTSWLFSEYGNNFVKTMLRLAKERDSLSVVHDQTGCPTYAGDLAHAIIELLQQPTSPRGIFHYCGNKLATWYEFTKAIFQTAQQLDDSFRIPELNAITTDQYPLPAPRPAYSIMDCSRLETEFGIKPSDWQKALREILRKID